MAKKKKLSEEVEQNIINRVRQDVEFAKRGRVIEADRWRQCRKWYDSEWANLDAERAKTSLFLPISRAKAMRLVTAMMMSFIGGTSFGKVMPQTQRGGDPDSAEMMHRLLDFYIQQMIPITKIVYDVAETAFVDGPVVLRATWDQRWDGSKLIANQPEVMVLPNEDVLIDPFRRVTEGIRYIVHWREEDLDEMWAKQDAKIYHNVEKVAGTAGQHMRGPAAEQGFYQTPNEPENRQRKTVQIYEYWGPLQLRTAEEVDRLHAAGKPAPPEDVVVTIAGSANGVILRDPEDNPYAKLEEGLTPYGKLPFIVGYAIPQRGTIYGTSPTWLGRALQQENNKIRNERRDNVSLTLNPRTLFNVNSGLDVEQYELARTGGLVSTEDLENSTKESVVGNVTQAAYREEEVNRRDNQELWGVTDYNQGMAQPGMTDTATGISILTEQANARFGLYGQMLKDTVFIPLLRKIANYILEFAEQEEVRQILVSPSEQEVMRKLGQDNRPKLKLKNIINRQFDIKMDAGIGVTGKSAQIRNLEHALQIIMQMANIDPEGTAQKAKAITDKLLPLLDVSVPEGGGQGGPPPQQQPGQGGSPPRSRDLTTPQRLGMENRRPTQEETSNIV